MTTATISVLITDLVGSTELLRLGAEASDDVRRAHFSVLRQALEEHRGTEVKSMGDGLMVTFVSASDAVACAVAVQQAVTRLRRHDPRSPEVRVGLACGEATSEDGDWYGQCVVEAVRLCSDATGGQILATAVVPALVGSRGRHDFRPVGERVLKGFDEPVGVVEVGWSPAPDRAQLPLLPAAELAASGFIVGRSEELDALRSAWKDAQVGQRRALLVSGEPGVGKTRLVAELARTAHGEGALVVWGRCDEELPVAYQPFVDVVRQLIEHAGTEAITTASDRAVLARLLPEFGEPAPSRPPSVGSDADADRYRLFDLVNRLVAGQARELPVLLVLDDIHWAATPTLLLMRHLVRDPSPAALLVVGTYRDTELDRAHPLAGMLADFRREPNVERHAVAGLDHSGVLEFIEATAGERLGEGGAQLGAAIHAQTEGNPFFVGQVLRHLAETGALARIDGRWATTAPLEEIGIPEGVREVVGRRLSRLSEDANRALAVGAVIGPDFDLATLGAVADAGEPERLLGALDEAVASHLVNESGEQVGRYAFAHALVRQTLLAELTAARRARLHHLVGEALARQAGVAPGAVANHLCAGAAAGSVREAVDWSLAAIDDATMRLAFEEAVVLGERALQVLDLARDEDRDARARVLWRLTANMTYAGETDRAKEIGNLAVDAARRAGDAVLLGNAVMARTSWAQAGVPDAEGGEMLAEALEALGDREPSIRAELLATLALYRGVNQNIGAAAAPDARRAIELARQTGDRHTELIALFVCGSVYQGTADVAAQLAVIEEMRLAEAAADDDIREFNWFPRCRLEVVAHLQVGDRAGFDAALAETRRRSAGYAIGSLPETMAAMWQAMADVAEGRFADAEANTAVLVEAGERDVNFQNSYAALMFRIAWERGTAGGLVPLVREAAEQTPGLVALQSLLAQALVAAGELEEARAVFGRLAADGFAAVPRDVVWSATLAQLTETCVTLGDRSAAADLHALLLPFAGQVLITAWGVHCHAAADRYLGMLDALSGRLDDADSRFAAALALEERCGLTALASRTRLWWARALRERDRPTDAARADSLAREAADAAAAFGQADVEAGARASRRHSS